MPSCLLSGQTDLVWISRILFFIDECLVNKCIFLICVLVYDLTSFTFMFALCGRSIAVVDGIIIIVAYCLLIVVCISGFCHVLRISNNHCLYVSTFFLVFRETVIYFGPCLVPKYFAKSIL